MHSHMQDSLQVITGLMSRIILLLRKLLISNSPPCCSFTQKWTFYQHIYAILTTGSYAYILHMHLSILQCNDYLLHKSLSVLQRILFYIHRIEYFHKCKIIYIYIYIHTYTHRHKQICQFIKQFVIFVQFFYIYIHLEYHAFKCSSVKSLPLIFSQS